MFAIDNKNPVLMHKRPDNGSLVHKRPENGSLVHKRPNCIKNFHFLFPWGWRRCIHKRPEIRHLNTQAP